MTEVGSAGEEAGTDEGEIKDELQFFSLSFFRVPERHSSAKVTRVCFWDGKKEEGRKSEVHWAIKEKEK